MTIIDTLTKFAILEPVKTTNATMTVRKLAKLVERFGAPNRIISDRGTGFTADKFEEFCTSQGIKHTLNSSRRPQANGLVERMNRTLLQSMIIRTEQGDLTEWEREVELIARDVNLTISKATGRGPYEALYGYLPRFGDGRTRELTEHCEMYQDPARQHNVITENIVRAQREYKLRYDGKHYKNAKFEIGDIVFVRVNPISTGESTKLQAKYKGPMIVKSVYPSDSYEIENLSGSRKTRHPVTAHVSQLRIWRGRDVASGDIELEDEPSSDEEEEHRESNDAESCTEIVISVIKEQLDRNIKETASSRPKRITQKPKRLGY